MGDRTWSRIWHGGSRPERLTHNGTTQIEPRWPPALAVAAVLVILAVLPHRLRPFPSWFPYILGLAVLGPMAAVAVGGARERWLRTERILGIFFFVVAAAATLASLAILIRAMIYRSAETSGLQLLTTSVAQWVTNVLVFSLLYWQIDRGGPEARANHVSMKPDWLFPQQGAQEDVPAGWHPTFVDYLFLGYVTATAFSPTDVLPLTARAKLLMMLESSISLVTLAVVAARAINVLGN